MNIGLIDADLMWQKRANGRRYGKTKADIFPNLATMKISAYHKQRGDDVEWYNGFRHYDRVYVSKVFSTTPETPDVINADEVIRGGSGYCIQLDGGREVWRECTDENFSSYLPYEVEHIMPDYSLYPTVNDTAMGFLSRGCPRGCRFCHVAAKEGRRAYKVADLSEWWSGQRNICLCMAWDQYWQKDAVLRGLQCFADNFHRKLDKGHWAQVFVLTNFDTTPEQDLERIYTLRDMGFEPYVMVYDKQHAAPFYKSLQRWVNMRAIFHRVKTFEEYDRGLAKE